MIDYGLTEEQQRIRATTLGASEIAAVAGIHPRMSPLDVWLRKRGGEGVDDQEEVEAMTIGNLLEPSLSALYEHKTGVLPVRRRRTYVHPEYPWVSASPDAEIGEPTVRLVEYKVVGFRMVRDWDEGPPAYTRAQAEWQMLVCGIGYNNVAALIGTTFPIYEFEADPELAGMLLEIGRKFWDYVESGEPPPLGALEKPGDYVKKLYPHGSREVVAVPEEKQGSVAYLIERLQDFTAQQKAVESDLESVHADLQAVVADNGGIEGPWGKYTWFAQAGRPSYQKVAEELAPAGVVPQQLIEKHRGHPFRVARFSPPKERRR